MLGERLGSSTNQEETRAGVNGKDTGHWGTVLRQIRDFKIRVLKHHSAQKVDFTMACYCMTQEVEGNSREKE